MKKETLILMLLLVGLVANAQTYKTVKDIAYTTKNDAYAQERLKLDVYYPGRLIRHLTMRQRLWPGRSVMLQNMGAIRRR